MRRLAAALTAAALALGLALGAAGCANNKPWTLQSTVDDILGDIDSLLGSSSLPGKHVSAIRSVHEKQSWTFRSDAEDPLETTRRAVRGLAECNYASWQEAALVVEIVSSMADEHTSSLVRAEALDTLTRMAPWTFAAVVPPENVSSESGMIEGIKVLREAIDRKDTDPAFTAQVAGAVTMLATYPFERLETTPDEGTDNKAAARSAGTRLRTARGALRAINSRGLEGFHGDPGVREALDRAYVGLSAAVIRLTLEKAALGDGAETTRAAAVRDLGSLRPPGAAVTLQRVLRFDGFASVRREAAKALSGFAVEEAVPPLLDGLADEMAEVRGAAARSLEMLSGERFGDDRAAWVRWWQTRSAKGAASAPQPSGDSNAR